MLLCATCGAIGEISKPAQKSPQIKTGLAIPHSQIAPKIDGNLNDIIWQQASQLSLNYETNPGENAKPEVETKVWLVEDGDVLYVAFKAQESNPKAIRAFYKNRDDVNDDDFVSVIIDTFNDSNRAYTFNVNALGVQGDAIIYQDRANKSWDAIWDAASVIDKQGYTVEMAIPLNVLSFPNAEQQQWGINLVRTRPRDIKQKIEFTPRDRNNACSLCQLTSIEGFTGVEPKNRLLVIPSLTSSYSQEKPSLSDAVGYDNWQKSDGFNDFGLDVEWGVNVNSTVNFTYNPDFSQVEADSMQLTVNNQFALRFDERRNFFLEGADYFNSPLRAIYTRSIADPDYGLKYTSKSDGHRVGLIVGHDAVTNVIQPNEYYNGTSVIQLRDDNNDENPLENNFVIGRYSYDFGNASNVSTLVTHRSGGSYSNTVAGADTQYRFTDNDSITVQLLSSDTQYTAQQANLTDNAYRLRYAHDERNWFAFASYTGTGKDFRADLGFFNRFNSHKLVAGGGYIWYGESDDFLNRIRISGDWDKTKDDDGLTLEEEAELYLTLRGPMQSRLRLGGGHRDNLYSTNTVSETDTTSRLDTLYYEQFFSIDVGVVPVSGLSIRGFFSFSDRVDYANNQQGDAAEYRFGFSYNVDRHLQLDLDYAHSTLDVVTGRLFTEELLDLRVNYVFDTRASLRLNAQLSEVNRDSNLYLYDTVNEDNLQQGLQLLFAYRVNPKTVAFIGYGDSGFSDDSTVFTHTYRSVFSKFSYAF